MLLKSRKFMVLPKVEGCIKLEIDTQLNTPREWSYTSRTSRNDLAFQNQAAATITVSSGKHIHLYTPMQESKRAQRLKNIPYELQYFQTSLPTKNFKSSHLMSDDLLKQPTESMKNMRKWQLRSHINRSNHVYTQQQIRRLEKNAKQSESSDIQTMKKQNVENIEKEKQKRNQQYKQATQKLIDQFTERFNIKALYEKGELN